MEQLRLFLAIILSLLVFLVWNYFFSKTPEPQPVATTPPAQVAHEAASTAAVKASPPAQAPAAAQEEQAPARMLTVEGPLYTLVINTRGAVVAHYKLKNYRETVDPNSPYMELISKENTVGTLQLAMNGQGFAGLSQAVFSTAIPQDHLVVKGKDLILPLVWTSPKGIVVEKRFIFHPDTYLIGLDVSVFNGSSQQISDSPIISLRNDAPLKKARYGFEGPTALINGGLKEISIDSIKKNPVYRGHIGWIALQGQYFMTSILQKGNADTELKLDLSSDDIPQVTASWVQPASLLAPQGKKTFSYDLYFGPKKISILKSLDNGLERAVDFGWFDFIARPCLWIMNQIYRVVPNYGLAIIILTIFIKVLLWPLGQKSYKSMEQMKRMQPLMAEIREKYKNDKKRMNEEMMGLYRTYKVNPLGGCLPMAAQIPVFFAFYRMLYEAIELRHAPFFGWINDLSAPDRLFHFNIQHIPFMDPPYGIPVLTIIMGATMFIQQKMQPPMGDPTQAKMMMLMPVVFTVVFVNFSSGLVLYWLVNNVFSILQQYLIRKKTA
jgi:YidC/Oxa1 family membrane protein insertase